MVRLTDLDSDLLLFLLDLGRVSLGWSSGGSLGSGGGLGLGSGSNLDWLVGGTVNLGSYLDIVVGSTRLGVGGGWLLVNDLTRRVSHSHGTGTGRGMRD